jgi:hypothetical protein
MIGNFIFLSDRLSDLLSLGGRLVVVDSLGPFVNRLVRLLL